MAIKTPDEQRTASVQAWVSTETKLGLLEIAKEYNVSISGLTRIIIENFLRQMEEKRCA